MAKKSRRKGSAVPALAPDHYFARSQQPLQSLIFLLPLILLYEIGAFQYATPLTGRRISAWADIQRFLEQFGAVGDFLPAAVVVAVLLAWHIANRDRWSLQPGTYAAMAAESVALALPLLLLGLLIGPGQPLAALAGQPAPMPWQAEVIFSAGAGVYEELLFRLAAIAVIHLVLVDLMGLSESRGATVAILLSAFLFAAYHFPGLNPLGWPLPRFLFYFAAGVYLAVVYILRGFGIAAASHAFYDMLVVLVKHEIAPSQ